MQAAGEMAILKVLLIRIEKVGVCSRLLCCSRQMRRRSLCAGHVEERHTDTRSHANE